MYSTFLNIICNSTSLMLLTISYSQNVKKTRTHKSNSNQFLFLANW